MTDHWLVTGGTGFVGGWLVRGLAAAGTAVTVVARPTSHDRMRRLVAAVEADSPGASARVQIVDGDVESPLCGLRSDVLTKLARETTVMVHAAARLRVPSREEGTRTNVEGTVAAMEVARRLPALRRFVHVSSIAVAGDYGSRFYEDWLDVGQKFRSFYARSKYEGEARVREARDLPTVVVRPGSVVGDSRTGEAWGTTTLVTAIHAVRRLAGLPRWTPLPAPFLPRSRYPVVPVDFVVDAIRALVDVEAPAGRTYCLVEPDAPSINDLLALIADRVGAPKPRVRLPVARALSGVASVPVLSPLLRRMGLRVDFLTYLDQPHDYDVSNTTAALEPRGLRCPRLKDYVDRIVAAT